jgi:hypothetical protein
VSTSGGTAPRWSRNGRELFYIAPNGNLMAVAVGGGGTFEAGAPQALFRTPLGAPAAVHSSPSYDVSPDGQRFLMPVSTVAPTSQPISAILNWRTRRGAAAATP